MTPPEAKVVRKAGPIVRIQCPLCGQLHEHKIRREGHQHFAPACGMFRSSDERATGYTFEARK